MQTPRGIGNDLVREARKRVGLTQRELAERAGTTQSAIARLESGGTAPSFDLVLRLVRLCGLDLDVMLVERDDSDMAQAFDVRHLPEAERIAQGVATANVMAQIQGRAAG